MPEEVKKTPVFSDYLFILYKWRKFLLINLSIVSVLTVIIVLLIPNNYKATATITIPPDAQGGLSGLGGLSGIIGGKSSIASMGAKLFGLGSSTSEDMLLGIINSRSAKKTFIDRFDLMEYYSISENNYDKAIKAFNNDISADINEFQMIEISIIHEETEISAEMANYIVEYVDSVNTELNIEQAKNNRLFIEKRYLQNVADLKKAEDSLYSFQSQYGIVAVPEQLEVSVKAAAEIESELFKKEVESYFVKEIYGKDSPVYKGVEKELNLLKDKVSDLKKSSDLNEKSNILYPFQKMPDIAIGYLRVYREVEIQQSILEFVMPIYEQAKVEEQKSMPTVVVIDKAVPPQLKYRPKRSVICIGVFMLATFILVPFVFFSQRAYYRNEFENPIQSKETDIVKRIVKFYKLKF